MRSPFPGMDPYLEGALWTSVHMQLSLEIARELAPMLRPTYVVRTPRRFVAIESSGGGDEVTVEIRDSADHELVTAIEILSPTKKRGLGRKECISQRNRFLLGGVHLIEIDLLRAGERVPIRKPLPPYPIAA